MMIEVSCATARQVRRAEKETKKERIERVDIAMREGERCGFKSTYAAAVEEEEEGGELSPAQLTTQNGDV